MNHLARAFDAFVVGIVVIVCLCVAFLAGGCASTTIERPDGFRYASTKDVAIGHLKVQEFYPDGKPKLVLDLDNGTGNASAVNERTFSTIDKAIERIPVPAIVPPIVP